jgi:hypothetical protein
MASLLTENGIKKVAVSKPFYSLTTFYYFTSLRTHSSGFDQKLALVEQ